jgi:hypothetical protein
MKMHFASHISENVSISIAKSLNKQSTVFETSLMIYTFIILCTMYHVEVEDLSDIVPDYS